MRHLILSLVALAAIAFSASGCVPIVATAAAAGGYAVGKDKRTFEQISIDAGITAQVKAALVREPGVHSLKINVDTYENVVTLKGEVTDTKEKLAAERVARGVEGVKGVRDELKVEAPAVEEHSQRET